MAAAAEPTVRTCNIDYYEMYDEYNRGNGSNSQYLEYKHTDNFVSICKSFGVETMKDAVKKWPSLRQLFPEARYLLAREPFILEHNLAILSIFYLRTGLPWLVTKRMPPDLIRKIAEWVGPPPGLPLVMLCDDNFGDDLDVWGYFDNGGGHGWGETACRACKDFMASPFFLEEDYHEEDYFGHHDLPCIELPLGEFMDRWKTMFEKGLGYNPMWEATLLRNYDLRGLLRALLGAMGYEFVEDAFVAFPFLRDEFFDEDIEERAKAYAASGEDYTTDLPALPEIPIPEGTPADDYATRNKIHEQNWERKHEQIVHNLVRRILRKGPTIVVEVDDGE